MKSQIRVVRKSIAEINLNNLVENYRKIRRIVRNKKIIGVVKADAYGHGAVKVAAKLEKEGIFALGVAYASEAVELREAGIESRIIVFFDNENIDDYFRHNLTPVIFEKGSAGAFSRAAKKHGRPIDAHIKIDTGMGRVGLLYHSCLENIVEINSMDEINVVGMMSHFSEADLQDRRFAEEQLFRFKQVIDELNGKGIRGMAHIANSAGVETFHNAHLDAVRPGLILYGYSPFSEENGFLPVMIVKSHIISLRKVPAGTPISYGRTFVTKRPSLIGVISVGYADGYSRLFSNNAFVLVNEKKAPVVGRVCMDLTMIDVTEIKGVEVGDEAILLSDDFTTHLTANDLANRVQTIPYEILTSFGNSAERIYINNG